jgi:hypothetical protein
MGHFRFFDAHVPDAQEQETARRNKNKAPGHQRSGKGRVQTQTFLSRLSGWRTEALKDLIRSSAEGVWGVV